MSADTAPPQPASRPAASAGWLCQRLGEPRRVAEPQRVQPAPAPAPRVGAEAEGQSQPGGAQAAQHGVVGSDLVGETATPFALIEMGEDPYRQVVYVGEDTVAERAGIQVGDVLLTMDGVDLVDKESFNRTVAGRHWGDLSSITVRREGETVEIPVRFTRSTPED